MANPVKVPQASDIKYTIDRLVREHDIDFATAEKFYHESNFKYHSAVHAIKKYKEMEKESEKEVLKITRDAMEEMRILGMEYQLFVYPALQIWWGISLQFPNLFIDPLNNPLDAIKLFDELVVRGFSVRMEQVPQIFKGDEVLRLVKIGGWTEEGEEKYAEGVGWTLETALTMAWRNWFTDYDEWG